MDILERRQSIIDAISVLSDNIENWSFERIRDLMQWRCLVQGVEEARIISVTFHPDGKVHFIVEDKGQIKFAGGRSTFEVIMSADELSDEQESRFLCKELVQKLNELHGL